MKYNYFKMIPCVISILFFAWLAVSFVDVINCQNCGGTDAMWNFFNLMVR